MLRQTVIAIAAVAFAGLALASSPDAMNDYDKEVTDACFKASGFKDAKAHTQLIMFDDSVGMDALIVEGEYPQEHMKGQQGKMLCLFNKTTRTAVASEMMHKE